MLSVVLLPYIYIYIYIYSLPGLQYVGVVGGGGWSASRGLARCLGVANRVHEFAAQHRRFMVLIS